MERANPLADGCQCEGCNALRAEIGKDKGLVTLYGKKLLIRGWAGVTTEAEKRYIMGHAPWAQAAARNAAATRFTKSTD